MLTSDTTIDIPLSNEDETHDLMSKADQYKFILQTYMCLTFQFFITTCFALVAKTDTRVQLFMTTETGYILQGISLFSIFSILFASLWYEKYFTIYKTKYTLLVLFTLSFSYNLSCLLNIANNDLVLLTSGLTLANTILLSILSMCTKINNSYLIQLLSVITLTLITTGILGVIFQSQIFYLFMSTLGTLLFSGFIILDTKMILSNTFRIYKQTDFVLASINLYTDIINLFLYLLRCLQLMSSD